LQRQKVIPAEILRKLLSFIGITHFLSVALLCSFGQELLAQDQSIAGNKLVFADYWDENTPKDRWPIKSDKTYQLSIVNGAYSTECFVADKTAYFIPKEGPELNFFQCKVDVNIIKKKNETGSVALVIDIERMEDQNNFTAGFIFEINGKRQFKLTGINNEGNLISLTGDEKSEYWVKSGFIKSAGNVNTLQLNQLDNKIDCYINAQLVHSINIKKPYLGKAGLYIKGTLAANFDNFELYQSNKDTATTKPIAIVNTEVPLDPIEQRKLIRDLKLNLGTCTEEYEALLQYKEQLEQYIKDNINPALRIELDKTNATLQQKEVELQKLRTEVSMYQDIKAEIEKNKYGDQVLIYAEKYEEEKKKNEALAKKLKASEDEVKRLSKQRK